MPSSAETSEEKLASAIKAVYHVLSRITREHQVAYLMGHCTESYELLCQAVATYRGETVAEVLEIFAPAREPSTPTHRDSDGHVPVMSLLAEQVCEALNVAPFIAAQIIAFAEQRDHPLVPFPSNASSEDRFAFEARAHRAYLAFFEAHRFVRLQAA